MRVAAFVVVLFVALSPPVLVWNAVIATESLAVSLLALAVALWLRVATGAGRNSLVLLVVVLIALACTRDTNAYLLLPIAALAVAVGIARRDLRRRGLAVAAACLVAAVVNIGLANHAQRWYYPVTETITNRIIGSPSATRYFVAHGMPDAAQLKTLYRDGHPEVVTWEPGFRAFRDWVLHHGRSTYTAFLATHPGWDLAKPFGDRRRFFAHPVSCRTARSITSSRRAASVSLAFSDFPTPSRWSRRGRDARCSRPSCHHAIAPGAG